MLKGIGHLSPLETPNELAEACTCLLKGRWTRLDAQVSYENFATGFWASGERRAEVWGRPAALAVAADGALLVADDTGGTIWRITYTGDHQRADRR